MSLKGCASVVSGAPARGERTATARGGRPFHEAARGHFLAHPAALAAEPRAGNAVRYELPTAAAGLGSQAFSRWYTREGRGTSL